MKPADLTRLFRINHQALHANLEGLSNEDALVQPESGNCLNWVLGHIVASRNGILAAMGRELYWPAEEASRYKRGSAPVTGPEGAKPFDRLVKDFDATQERILAALESATQADLDKPHSSDQTVGEWVAFLHFHEAYHVGQTAILRRLAGKEGAIR